MSRAGSSSGGPLAWTASLVSDYVEQSQVLADVPMAVSPAIGDPKQ